MLNNYRRLKIILSRWLLLALVISGLSALIYAVVQQNLRQSANDPQIQMAEDAAANLASGQKVQNVVPSVKINIASSLAPYLIVFDNTGKPIASSAQLNGQTPTLPAGVFDYVRQNNEDRITWQPQPDVRSAAVVTQYKGTSSGFVLAGRSLREVEIREDNTIHLVLLGWIALLFLTLLGTAFTYRNISKE